METSFLNEIEKFFIKNKCKLVPDYPFKESLAREFGLKVLDSLGTTRCVFKKPYSREVIKVGYPMHNKGEASASEFLKDTPYKHLFAKVHAISSAGYVTSQEYIPRKLPEISDFWVDPSWLDLRSTLENEFSFVKNLMRGNLCDFHDENMRIARDGNIKIIDYTQLASETFRVDPKLKISTAVKRLRKLSRPDRNLRFRFIEDPRSIRLDVNSSTLVVNPSKSAQRA